MTPGLALERGGDRRRDFRRMVWFSMAGHALLVLGSAVSMPTQQGIAIPNVITVDLMVAPTPARARPAPPAPRAKPKPKQVVLPERPSTPTPKPKPRRREEVVLEPKPREEKSLDDLLEQFREEQGEPKPTPAPPRTAAEPAPVVATATAGIGVPVSAEEMDWMRRAKIHVRKSWVVPANFRLHSLQTEIVVKLDASGNVKGKPRIVRRSGNPYYDENVVRSIEKASPLPPPPESGDRTFIFASDDI